MLVTGPGDGGIARLLRGWASLAARARARSDGAGHVVLERRAARGGRERVSHAFAIGALLEAIKLRLAGRGHVVQRRLLARAVGHGARRARGLLGARVAEPL